MKFLRRAGLPAALLAVAAVAWWAVTRGPPAAKWLRVEVPAQAVIGERFPVTILLRDAPANAWVGIDLHWRDGRRESRGRLTGAPPQRTGAREQTYTFDLALPAREGLAYVYGVIYVSPTGRWAERSRACTLEPIPVTTKADPRRAQIRRRIAAYDLSFQPKPVRRDSGIIRWTSVALLVITGLICARLARTDRGTRSAEPLDFRFRWGWLALACLLAAFWEATTAESVLGGWFRKLALDRGWYEQRRLLQQLLTTAVIVFSTGAATAALRRARTQPASLLFCAADIYWGITAVSFISLHNADAWLATPVLGIPVVQLIKLVLAIVAVAATATALRVTAIARPPP